MEDFILIPVPKGLVTEVYGFISDRTKDQRADDEFQDAKEKGGIETFFGLLAPGPEWLDTSFRQEARSIASPQIVRAIQFLRKHPEEWIPMKRLADESGVNTKSLGASMGVFARQIEKMRGHKAWPFTQRLDAKQLSEYCMPQELADILDEF